MLNAYPESWTHILVDLRGILKIAQTRENIDKWSLTNKKLFTPRVALWHNWQLTPARHPWVLWLLFKKLVYECRGLSSLRDVTETFSAKWESCSLSALTFCFQEVPVPSQSVLQARQLLLEPEWQQLALKFLVQVPFLLVSETDVVKQWLRWLCTLEEPPFFVWAACFFWQSWGISVRSVEEDSLVPVAFRRGLPFLEFPFKWRGLDLRRRAVGLPDKQRKNAEITMGIGGALIITFVLWEALGDCLRGKTDWPSSPKSSLTLFSAFMSVYHTPPPSLFMLYLYRLEPAS